MVGKSLKTLSLIRKVSRILNQEIRRVLSPMENRVLEYYLKGYGYVRIAEIMGKTPKSIDNALQRIRGKDSKFFTFLLG